MKKFKITKADYFKKDIQEYLKRNGYATEYPNIFQDTNKEEIPIEDFIFDWGRLHFHYVGLDSIETCERDTKIIIYILAGVTNEYEISIYMIKVFAE